MTVPLKRGKMPMVIWGPNRILTNHHIPSQNGFLLACHTPFHRSHRNRMFCTHEGLLISFRILELALDGLLVACLGDEHTGSLKDPLMCLCHIMLRDNILHPMNTGINQQTDVKRVLCIHTAEFQSMRIGRRRKAPSKAYAGSPCMLLFSSVLPNT